LLLNHKAAIEMLVEHAGEIAFNTFTFFNLHALLSENLLADPNASGRLRTTIVEIGGTVYHPLAIPQQIEEYFRLILEKTNAIRDPFEQAFFLMVQIPYLQPFLDVNKRVSRLGANIPLIKQNLSPLSFVDVPEQAYIDGTLGVYELNRIELLRDVFVWAYERSCQRYVAIKESLPEPDAVRLRNREALISVVSEIVRGGKPINSWLIRELAAPLVKPDDLGEFVAMAFNDLHHLHEGNIVRYRLRLPEFSAWTKQ
jgi:Fic family protein